MAREGDRIPQSVACLNTAAIPATLVSTLGFHCEVWRSAGIIVRDGERVALDFVVKRHRFACTLAKLRAYRREYRMLCDALGTIVPAACFVATRIDAQSSVVVLAETRVPWFDLADPGNEDEARPLLARLPKARAQLARFVDAARAWQRDSVIVDLYGRQNLVLDRALDVGYLDSFGVFLYADTLHTVDGVDADFAHRIEVSCARLDYVASLLGPANR